MCALRILLSQANLWKVRLEENFCHYHLFRDSRDRWTGDLEQQKHVYLVTGPKGSLDQRIFAKLSQQSCRMRVGKVLTLLHSTHDWHHCNESIRDSTFLLYGMYVGIRYSHSSNSHSNINAKIKLKQKVLKNLNEKGIPSFIHLS